MRRMIHTMVIALVIASSSDLAAQQSTGPDTVDVESGGLVLRALVWRPSGRGPFPAVLFNHGSGPAELTLAPNRLALGPLFARHGYVFMFLFRRGSGLSAGQGENSFDVINNASAAGGISGRNSAQMSLVEGDDLDDAMSGLAVLQNMRDVDTNRIALVAHSFGGSLTLLMTERDPSVRAAVIFGVAAGSWKQSEALRRRLIGAAGRTRVPVFFIHASNDFSVLPGRTLAAEMRRRDKRQMLRIYPPSGRTVEEGHDFIFREIPAWEQDVFAFLSDHLKR